MGLYRGSEKYTAAETPFAGFIDGVPAVSGPHVLVSGPSGCGKTRRVLAPGILMWRGPVVAISSKPDLIDVCLEQRLAWGGRDRTYVLDLSGEVPDDVLLEGVHRVVVDPVALLRSDDDAIDMAAVLMKSGTAGASSGSGGGGDAFWETLATGPLAAVLRAAGADGIEWAMAAISMVEPGEGAPDDKPSWTAAIDRLVGVSALLANELESAAKLDSKMRDSVAITMRSAVAPWLRSTVAGRGSELTFTPELLTHPASTLFIVAPADGVAAGAAVAAVDFITKRWRANQTEKVRLPRLLLCVDETCNTLPWPKLPTVVTEARAMGVNLLVAVQATSQFALRYGEAGMRVLRETFPAVLLLRGAPEFDMLESAARWSGKVERQKIATDHLGKQSQSLETEDAMTAASLLPRNVNEGRLLRGSRPGTKIDSIAEAGLLVSLVDISQLTFTEAG